MDNKTPSISDGKGKITLRPAGQDIKPKVFQFSATLMITMFETPTERRLLWMISHYPYIFNAFFLGDMLGINPKAAEPNSKLSEALKVLHSLNMKGYIKQSTDLLKWHLTLTGRIYRITSHAAWPVIAVGLAATVAFTIFGLNKGCSKEQKTIEGKESTITTSFDSALYKPAQTVSLTVEGASLVDSVKTKAVHK